MISGILLCCLISEDVIKFKSELLLPYLHLTFCQIYQVGDSN